MSCNRFLTNTRLADVNLFPDVDFPHEDNEVLDSFPGPLLLEIPDRQLTDEAPISLYDGQVNEGHIQHGMMDIDPSIPALGNGNDDACSSYFQYDHDDFPIEDSTSTIRELFLDGEHFSSSLYNTNTENNGVDGSFPDAQPLSEHSIPYPILRGAWSESLSATDQISFGGLNTDNSPSNQIFVVPRGKSSSVSCPKLSDDAEQRLRILQPATNPQKINQVDEALARATNALRNETMKSMKRKLDADSCFGLFKIETKRAKVTPTMTLEQRAERQLVRKSRACLLCRLLKRGCSSDTSVSCARCVEWAKRRADLGFTVCLRDHPSKFNPYECDFKSPKADWKKHRNDGLDILRALRTDIWTKPRDKVSVSLLVLMFDRTFTLLRTGFTDAMKEQERFDAQLEIKEILSYTSQVLLNMVEDALRDKSRTALSSKTSLDLVQVVAFLYACSIYTKSTTNQVHETYEKYLLMCLSIKTPRAASKKTFKTLSHSGSNRSEGTQVLELIEFWKQFHATLPKLCPSVLRHILVVSNSGYIFDSLNEQLDKSSQSMLFQGLNCKRVTEQDFYSLPELSLPASPAGDPTFGLAVWSLHWHAIPKYVKEAMDFTAEDFLNFMMSPNSGRQQRTSFARLVGKCLMDWNDSARSWVYSLYTCLSGSRPFFNEDSIRLEEVLLSLATNFPLPLLSELVPSQPISTQLQSCFRWWLCFSLADAGLIGKLDLLHFSILRLDSRDHKSCLRWHSEASFAHFFWGFYRGRTSKNSADTFDKSNEISSNPSEDDGISDTSQKFSENDEELSSESTTYPGNGKEHKLQRKTSGSQYIGEDRSMLFPGHPFLPLPKPNRPRMEGKLKSYWDEYTRDSCGLNQSDVEALSQEELTTLMTSYLARMYIYYMDIEVWKYRKVVAGVPYESLRCCE